ncbi:IPT/TIG domain-containing protein [Burkholderia pseudomallei]|nr:IPT/TIG domain-containing protein [Burkholderia pseudomallei]
MESRGNGRQVMEGGLDGSSIRERLRRWLDRSFRAAVIGLLGLLLLAGGIVHAQSTRYVYDANGRVVAVTANSGSSVQYGYNTLGHASQVSAPLSSGQLAIFSFMPTHGEAGTQVTIHGQGFDSNAANDTVSFNGTVATVISASATALVTTVPSGATTGPISVTVASRTATSATPFVIDDTGMPPVITQASPAAVSVGDTVTITGAHLDPVAGHTEVQMGGRGIAALTALSDTQLQYTVPSNGSSGYVTAATPYGLASSPIPVIVLPSGISASSVVSSGNAAVGSSGVTLSIGASGQFGALTFTAPQSGWVSLQASGITTAASSINYTVYAPGNNVIQQGVISASSPSIHLPHLVAGATYLILVQPNGAGAQMTLGVETNALLTINSAATLITTTPGQSKRVLFNALAGQNMVFVINGTGTNPSGQSVSYTVYTPSGATYMSGSTPNTGVINLGLVPTTGTYQIVIAPTGGATGSVQVEAEQGVGGVLGRTQQSFATNVGGQYVDLSFTATQNENLELSLSNMSMIGGDTDHLTAWLYDSAGNAVAQFACSINNPGGSCLQHLWYLSAGKYTLIVMPAGSGTLSFNASLQDDLVGPNVAVGSTANISLGAGQVERLTFNAKAGDTIALNVSGITTTPTGQGVTFLVYRPDAGAITVNTSTYTSFSPTGSQTVNLTNLPVSGTYTVIASPSYGLPATAQFSVVPGATGTLASGGTSQSYTANVSGEQIALSFTATQNENLELTFNNISVSGSGGNQFNAWVFDGTGRQVASFTCYGSNPGNSCTQHLWYLSAGTYTVFASQDNGTISFDAVLQDDLVGPNVAVGNTTNISLGAGQVERLTFNAKAGDTIALNVSSITTTPAGQGVTFWVYRPDAGAITINTSIYTSFNPTGSQTVNLTSLPVSGTYTVIASPSYGLPATAQFSVVPGATGTLANGGASQSYTANVSGEYIALSFTATQNENLELTFNNISVSGSGGNQFTAWVYDSAGRQVSNFSCYGTNPGNSCTQHLWYLSRGTYTVLASQDNGTISFNALLQEDITGQTLAAGDQTSMYLNAGQVQRVFLTANAGDTVQLQAAWLAPSATNTGVNFLVYRPDAGAITTNATPYTSFHSTATQTVNLSNLPVSGTYTVVVAPDYGLPASVQLGDLSQAMTNPPVYGTPTLPADGSTQTEGASGAGQSVTMTFNAKEGDNLSVLLSNFNTSVSMNVYAPGGNNIASNSCGNPACGTQLWNLAAGTYSIVVSPQNSGSTITFNAQLIPESAASALTPNTPVSLNIPAGYVSRYTFNANAGDAVALQLSGVSGTSMQMQVYRPDAGQIWPNNAYASTNVGTGSAQTMNLSNLPVSGTYVVLLWGGYPVSSGQLTLAQGTSGALANDGTSHSYSSGLGGQNVYMTFTAQTGDNLSLLLSNFSNAVNLNVYAPNGNNIASNSCGNPACGTQLWNLAAGTYSVVVSPQNGGSTVSFTAQLIPETAASALTPNTSVSLNIPAGYVSRYTFNANAGDDVALQLSGVSGTSMQMQVYRPDGGQITPSNAYASINVGTGSAQTMNLSNLPVSGTYVVLLWGGYPVSSGQLTLAQGTGGALASDGTSHSYSSGLGGQNVYMTFTAQTGDNLSLLLSNFSNSVNLNVYAPNGNNIASNSCGNPACGTQLWSLAAGTYSVVVSPQNSGSTVSFTAQLIPETAASALTPNTPVSLNIPAGYVSRYTFNANASEDVALQLSGVSGTSIQMQVYRPDGGQITPSNAYASINVGTGSAQTMNLSNLPVSGTYVVLLWGGYPGSTGQLTLQPPANARWLSTSGSISHFTAAAVGQSVTTAFSATPGANLELTLSNVNVLGAGTNAFEVLVTDPAGYQIANFYCYASSPGASCTQPLWNLMGGTYKVVAVPISGGTISFSAQLQSDINGGALTAGSATTVTLQTGQAERVTFSANQGSSVVLQLAGVSTTPANQSLFVDVYRPDAGEIETSNVYASFEATGSNSISLSNLPIGGTYTAVLHTATGIPANAQFSYATQ